MSRSKSRLPLKDRADSYPLQVDSTPLEIGAVSMGNPHAVLRVDDVDQADVANTWDPLIESHPDFPTAG